MVRVDPIRFGKWGSISEPMRSRDQSLGAGVGGMQLLRSFILVVGRYRGPRPVWVP